MCRLCQERIEEWLSDEISSNELLKIISHVQEIKRGRVASVNVNCVEISKNG